MEYKRDIKTGAIPAVKYNSFDKVSEALIELLDFELRYSVQKPECTLVCKQPNVTYRSKYTLHQ
jgi:hypothetical protein